MEAVARYPREDEEDTPVARVELLEPKGFKVYFANPGGLKDIIFALWITKASNETTGPIGFTVCDTTDWQYINNEFEFSSGDLIYYKYNVTYENGSQCNKDMRLCPISLPVTYGPNETPPMPTCVQRNGTVRRIYVAGVNTTVKPDEFWFFKTSTDKR